MRISMASFVRAIFTFPIILVGLPIAAFVDSRNNDRPDLYPARERIVYYISDWWSWVANGTFSSKKMELVEKGN